MRVRPDKSQVVPAFLALWCRSTQARQFLMSRAKQVTMTTIAQPDIAPLPVPLPLKTEQKKIVEVLDTIDTLISKTSTLIAKLKQMKAGLLHDLLTRGLNENGQLRDESDRHQFKDSPLGRIPKDWNAIALGSILIGIDAGKSPSCPDTPANSGEWGVLKVSAVHPSGFKSRENKVITNSAFITPAYEVKHNDLLITRSNTYDLVGLTCLVKAPPPRLLISDKTLRLNVNSQLASIDFLAHILQMPLTRTQIQLRATGSSAGMTTTSGV